ncbi:hypothetical protein STEG23_036510 [Scotinomys teguina]
MAAAAYVDHFAAECLVSMSSRAVVHEPREGTEPRPEGAAAAAPTLPRVDERRDGKDSASLFVVARILADLNQQAPAPAPAERREGAAARKARTPCRLPPAPLRRHRPRARLPGTSRRAGRAPQPRVERARGGTGTGAGPRGERRARPQTKGSAGPESRRPRVPAEEAQVPLRGLRESLRKIFAPQGAPENSHRSVGWPERREPAD